METRKGFLLCPLARVATFSPEAAAIFSNGSMLGSFASKKVAAKAERQLEALLATREKAAGLVALLARRATAIEAALGEKRTELRRKTHEGPFVLVPPLRKEVAEIETSLEQAREAHKSATAGLGELDEQIKTLRAEIARTERKAQAQRSEAEAIRHGKVKTNRTHRTTKRERKAKAKRWAQACAAAAGVDGVSYPATK